MIGLDTVFISSIPVFIVVAIIQLRRHASFWKTLGALVLTGYLVLLIAFTLFPLPTDARYIADMKSFGWDLDYNLVPFHTMRSAFADGYASGLVQVAGNFVMLAPLAVLLPMMWPRLRTWKAMVPIAIGVSCVVEGLQFGISAGLGFSYKRFDVDDLILNVLGATIVFGLFVAGRYLLRAAKNRRLRTRVSDVVSEASSEA